MRIGRMRDKIVVKTKTVASRDAVGGRVLTWATTATLWAEIDPYFMRTELNDRRQAGESAIAFRVRTPLTVSIGDRIEYGDANYEVVAIDPTRKHKGELTLTAKAEDVSV